jgi:GcrA cell cycle regulator
VGDNSKSIWTDDARVRQLRELWAQGKSASQIARIFGDCTKNAIIGKCHRLGLTDASRPHRNAPRYNDGLTYEQRKAIMRKAKAAARPVVFKSIAAKPTPPTKPQPFKEARQPSQVIALADAVEPLMLDLLDLGNGCKWPYGDGPFNFCGHAKTSGDSYCRPHMRVAFTCEAKPQQKPKRQRDTVPRRSNEDWFRGVAA